MNALLLSALLSLLPFTELRFAIPYAIARGVDPLAAFFVCVLGNVLVIPLVFLFLDHIHSKLLKIRLYEKLSESVLRRIRPKSVKVKRKIALYGFPALVLFVSFPLPVTGAYTGTTIAWLLDLERRKSFVAIAIGIAIAGIIITLISSGILLL